MKLSLMAYIVAISCQVSGSLMLIIFAISTKRKRIIQAFAKSYIITRDEDTKKLSYSHDTFIDIYRTAYFSKASVCFISVGYLLGIFGDRGDSNRACIAAVVGVMTIALIVSTNLCVKRLLKRDFVQKKISNEELEEVGAEPDREKIAGKSIDDLFV